MFVTARRHQHRSAKIQISMLAVGCLVGLLAFFAIGTILILLVRDPIPELTEQSLARAQDLWEKAGIQSYDLDLKLGGTWPGEVHVEVRQREVTAMTRDGKSPRQRHTWDAWSVLGQFDTMERELELAENPEREMHAGAQTRLLLKAQFHPKLGYPERYRRMVLGNGPEVYWETVRFQPQTNP